MHKLERILTGIALVVGLLSGLVLLNVGKTSTLEEVCIASLFGSFIVISLTLYDQVLVKLDTPFWKTWHNYWRS